MVLTYKQNYVITGKSDEIAEFIFNMEHFDRTISEPPALPAVIETPEEPKEVIRKPARKEVDWGKAKALRDAGWSYDKIGDELRVSGVTVSAHLRQMEQEVEEDA